jgi:tetratricopeptide (TPR) repeat protein
MRARIATPAAALTVAAALAAGAAAASQPRGSLAGAYLAGRHADASNDVGAAAAYYGAALAADPANGALMERALLSELAAGRIEDAAKSAQALAARDPAHRLANLALAVEDFAAGRHDAVRARVAERGDAFHPVLGALLDAWAAFAQGDRAAAEAALAKLDERPVFKVFGRFHAGLVRAAAGDHAGAATALGEAAAELSAPNSRIVLARGAALQAAGDAEAARRVYDQAAAAAFGDPNVTAARARLEAGEPPRPLVATPAEGAAEALFGLAGVLSNESGRRYALGYAQLALRLRPDLDSAAMLVAELFETDQRNDLALAAYDRVDAARPLGVRAAIGRAGALEGLDRRDEAIAALREAVAGAPSDPAAAMALADALRRAERWDECDGAYGAAIDLLAAGGRDAWTLYYQRGICRERAGRWDGAEADFLRALELEPEQPLVLNYLGYSWVEQRRELDRARKMIERAVELRPEDGYITDSLGWVLYRLGDYPGAVEWLERAVALVPDDPVINDHLGDALWMVGRRLEAEFQWRRARSFDPEPADLARIKRKLSVGLDAVLAEEKAGEPAAAAEAPRPPDGG